MSSIDHGIKGKDTWEASLVEADVDPNVEHQHATRGASSVDMDVDASEEQQCATRSTTATPTPSEEAQEPSTEFEQEEPNDVCSAGGGDTDFFAAPCVEADFCKHNGFISKGGDLLLAVMTVEDAKVKCLTLAGCRGFCHRGPPTDKPIEIIFKNKWDNEIGANPWTSYRVEASAAQLQSWDCQRCTFRHEGELAGFTHCTMCEEARGSGEPIQEASAASLPSWDCQSCTFRHEGDDLAALTSCTICDAPRESSGICTILESSEEEKRREKDEREEERKDVEGREWVDNSGVARPWEKNQKWEAREPDEARDFDEWPLATEDQLSQLGMLDQDFPKAAHPNTPPPKELTDLVLEDVDGKDDPLAIPGCCMVELLIAEEERQRAEEERGMWAALLIAEEERQRAEAELQRSKTEGTSAASPDLNVHEKDAPTASDSPVLGEVEVSFLSGETVKIPVHAGDSMGSVKLNVFRNRQVGNGMRPQLLHPTGVIQDDENAADYVGIYLTALFTRLDLSDEARLLLRNCTWQAPEDGCINLLEFRSGLTLDDMPVLSELLLQVQPKRLILTRAINELGLKSLAENLKANLEVETLHLPVSKLSLKDATKMLLRCSCLRTCYFTDGGRLTKEDVQDVRAKVKPAEIVI